MIATFALLLLLLVLAAFFSGSETALTAASRSRMHALAGQDNARATIVNRLRVHMERVIGAILISNNLVNILASALATSVLIGLFGESGVIYATVAMTVLIVLFGEVRSEEHTSELQSLMRISYAVFCLKNNNKYR